MPRIAPIDPAHADAKATALLDAVQKALGVTPNMMRTMAHSPAVLDAYLSMSGALASGRLSAKVREQLALVVAESNTCDYCAAAHTLLGQRAGLSELDAERARHGDATDPSTAAALRLARAIVASRGHVSDAELAAARAGGLGDAEIGEVVAHVGFNTFTNYFNSVAGTEVDFPAVRPTAKAA